MKRLMVISTFILLWPLAGFAQDLPKNEIAGTFTEFRESQIDKTRYSPGFDISYVRNLKSWFAAEAEYNGSFETDVRRFVAAGVSGPAIYEDRTNVGDHLLLFGPRFTYRKMSKVNLFAHALNGLRITTSDETFPVGTFPNVTNTTVHSKRTAYAIAAGGGVDVNITKKLAIRAVQADYIHTSHPLLFDHSDLRLSTGVVFRF
jgi:hypothetical protein